MTVPPAATMLTAFAAVFKVAVKLQVVRVATATPTGETRSRLGNAVVLDQPFVAETIRSNSPLSGKSASAAANVGLGGELA